MKATNINPFHEEMEGRFMEFPTAHHFETEIIMRHKLLKFIRLDCQYFIS